MNVPLPEAFKKYAPSLTAEEADPTVETLEHLAERGYDAVICWAGRSTNTRSPHEHATDGW